MPPPVSFVSGYKSPTGTLAAALSTSRPLDDAAVAGYGVPRCGSVDIAYVEWGNRPLGDIPVFVADSTLGVRCEHADAAFCVGGATKARVISSCGNAFCNPWERKAETLGALADRKLDGARFNDFAVCPIAKSGCAGDYEKLLEEQMFRFRDEWSLPCLQDVETSLSWYCGKTQMMKKRSRGGRSDHMIPEAIDLYLLVALYSGSAAPLNIVAGWNTKSPADEMDSTLRFVTSHFQDD